MQPKTLKIIEATRELSNRLWAGRRATTTQSLSWPRWWVINPDSPLGFFIDSTVVPQRVKDATCELAFQFIKAGTTDLAALDTSLNVHRKKVDVLETEYEPTGQRAKGLGRFPRVMDLIRPLLAAGSNASFNIVRG